MFLKNRSLHRKPRHNSIYLMAFHELSIGNSSKAINTTNYPIIWIRNPWLIHGVLMDFRHFTCTQVCSSAFTTVELRSSVTETKYFTIFRGFPWTCHSKPMEYHGHCRHFISLCYCAGWIRPSATRAWPCLNVAGLSQHRHPRLAAHLAGRPGRPCI